MAEHVAAGDRSFVDEEYDEAVQHYTKALEASPSSVVYESRANAYIKLEKYVEAVQDATKAIELDGKNAKAYLRKGTACFYLEEYETALQCFEQGQQLAPEDKKYAKWIHKCKAELDDEDVTDAPARSTAAQAASPASTATQLPSPAAPAPASAPAVPSIPAPAAATASSSTPLAPAAAATAAVEQFTGKYRHQWYQLGPKVTIDIYAKNQKQDAVSVELSNDNSHLKITIAAAADSSVITEQQQQQAEEDYVLELDLFGTVQPELKYEVLRTKVEVTLTKAQPTQSWHSLEKGAKGPGAAGVGVGTAAPPAAAEQGAPRLYPSSKGPKDWSKVEAEVKQLEEKGELEDGDPLNSFFKKIFAQGDEDTRRAMMKSFVESNGTVLSTNWKEVGAKTVECTPPEGAELHKWSENL